MAENYKILYEQMKKMVEKYCSGVTEGHRQTGSGTTMDQRGGQVAGARRICGMYSKKKPIFQIYANGCKNREKWMGKSDN